MKQVTSLGTREYALKSGAKFTVHIYQARGKRTQVSLRAPYGHLEAYCQKTCDLSAIDLLVNKFIRKHPGVYLNRDYMDKGNYAFILGEKKIYTSDPHYKDDDSYFYVPSSQIPENIYKKRFLSYAQERAQDKAEEMSIDLTGYQIKSDEYISMYGNCCPGKKTIKFDYRLFAYKSEIFDAVLTHELAHIVYLNHSASFYQLVKRYCPRYDEMMTLLIQGAFEG